MNVAKIAWEYLCDFGVDRNLCRTFAILADTFLVSFGFLFGKAKCVYTTKLCGVISSNDDYLSMKQTIWIECGKFMTQHASWRLRIFAAIIHTAQTQLLRNGMWKNMCTTFNANLIIAHKFLANGMCLQTKVQTKKIVFTAYFVRIWLQPFDSHCFCTDFWSYFVCLIMRCVCVFILCTYYYGPISIPWMSPWNWAASEHMKKMNLLFPLMTSATWYE